CFNSSLSPQLNSIYLVSLGLSFGFTVPHGNSASKDAFIDPSVTNGPTRSSFAKSHSVSFPLTNNFTELRFSYLLENISKLTFSPSKVRSTYGACPGSLLDAFSSVSKLKNPVS